MITHEDFGSESPGHSYIKEDTGRKTMGRARRDISEKSF